MLYLPKMSTVYCLKCLFPLLFVGLYLTYCDHSYYLIICLIQFYVNTLNFLITVKLSFLKLVNDIWNLKGSVLKPSTSAIDLEEIVSDLTPFDLRTMPC